MTPDAEATAVATETIPAGRSSRLGPLARQGTERYLLVLLWAVMFAFYAVLEPDKFATSSTIEAIFNSQAALVFLSMALLCTIVVGEFVDLSVAAVLGLSATIVSVLNVNHGMNVALASAIAVAAGLVVGIANGALVVGLGVNTIVVTLGMSSLLLGLALLMSDLNIISGLSPDFGRIALTDVLGLPISFWYGVAIAIAFAYVLAFTPLGRHMQFVGANREVSRLAGIRVNRIRFGAFVMAGLLSGVGGVVVAAGLGGFDAQTSVTYLLPAFAAVFLSTTVVLPGRFNPLGALIGVYFLATGILGLQILGANVWISELFYGAVLIVAVSLSTVVRRRRAGD